MFILSKIIKKKRFKFNVPNTFLITAMNEKLILKALREYGITEEAGTSVNDARIVQYSKDTKFNFSTDEVPWCSVFVNWVALQVGAQMSKSAMARSWLNVGTKILTPELGDVVILQRAGSPISGHVGFYIGAHEDGKRIYILGGNQSNQVNISAFNKSDLLGYRRLEKSA